MIFSCVACSDNKTLGALFNQYKFG